MRIQIEPSDILTEIQGVPCRVWNGVTESGKQVFLFVAQVAVPSEDRSSLEEFGEELIEVQPH